MIRSLLVWSRILNELYQIQMMPFCSMYSTSRISTKSTRIMLDVVYFSGRRLLRFCPIILWQNTSKSKIISSNGTWNFGACPFMRYTKIFKRSTNLTSAVFCTVLFLVYGFCSLSHWHWSCGAFCGGMTHFRVTHSVLPILLSGKDMTKKTSGRSMDLFVLLFAAAASTILVFASPGCEAAPQYYYPPPPNNYYYQNYNYHYYPLAATATSRQQEERLKPAEIMDSAKEYAKMTRSMADFIDTKGPDFLSLLGSELNYQPGNGPFHLSYTKKGKWKKWIKEREQPKNRTYFVVVVGRKLFWVRQMW